MWTFAPPRGEVTAAHLQLVRGREVTVWAASIDELCRAEFAGRTPKTVGEDGQVQIEYPRFGFPGMGGGGSAVGAEILLNSALPWTLTFVGGVGDSIIDLHAVAIVEMTITGGASNVRLRLPAPRGAVRVRVESGVSELTLLRPADVPAVLSVAGGASRLTFDGERYGAIGGETRLESPGADRSPERYEIDVRGGATDLTIVGEGKWQT